MHGKVGQVDVDIPINAGPGCWSFDTNFALTYLNLDNFEAEGIAR